jgi:hypothetical protein
LSPQSQVCVIFLSVSHLVRHRAAFLMRHFEKRRKSAKTGCHPERLREGPCVFAVRQNSQLRSPSLRRKKRTSVQDDSALRKLMFIKNEVLVRNSD